MTTYLLIGTLVVLIFYMMSKDSFREAIKILDEFEGFSKIFGIVLMLAGLILVWPLLVFGIIFDNK